MSNEEREGIKAEFVEGVRQHLQSVEKRKFLVSIGTAVAVIGAVVYGTWVCNDTLRDLREGQKTLQSSLNYKVSVGQFVSWTTMLEKKNRQIDGGRGLDVPDLPQPAKASNTPTE